MVRRMRDSLKSEKRKAISKTKDVYLKEGQRLSLASSSGASTHLSVSAGWELVTTRRSWWQKPVNELDIDLMAYLLDENGRLIRRGHIYYAHQAAPGIVLQEDYSKRVVNREQIILQLTEIPENCVKIQFALVIFSPHTLSQVKKTYISLRDEKSKGREIGYFQAHELEVNHNTMIMGELSRQEGNWWFKAIGQSLRATGEEIAKGYQDGSLS